MMHWLVCFIFLSTSLFSQSDTELTSIYYATRSLGSYSIKLYPKSPEIVQAGKAHYSYRFYPYGYILNCEHITETIYGLDGVEYAMEHVSCDSTYFCQLRYTVMHMQHGCTHYYYEVKRQDELILLIAANPEKFYMDTPSQKKPRG